MATESVNTFKSRYAYRFLLDEDRDKYAILNIRKLESSVRDIRSGEILGEVRTFSYHGGWIATRMYGFSLLRCPVPDPDPKVNSAHINLLHDVLKPIQP